MIKRLAIAFAAMCMWFMFGVEVSIAFAAFPFLTAVWVVRDSDWLRKRLTAYGQALDQCANVVFMDGHPKETISSHVGRIYSAKYGNGYKGMLGLKPDLVIPWQAVFVHWVTDFAEPDHVYKSVEAWAVASDIDL